DGRVNALFVLLVDRIESHREWTIFFRQRSDVLPEGRGPLGGHGFRDGLDAGTLVPPDEDANVRRFLAVDEADQRHVVALAEGDEAVAVPVVRPDDLIAAQDSVMSGDRLPVVHVPAPC